MKKLVFIETHNGGRLANQLWNFVSIYAYTLEKGYILINPTFTDYAGYFADFKGNDLLSPQLNVKFLPSKTAKFLLWFARAIDRRINISNTYQTGEDANAIILPPTVSDSDFNPTKPVIFLNGWLYRNTKGLEKYREEVMHKFRPAPEYALKIDEFWNSLDEDSYKIGVHIRRTDYKQHLNGRYYFELDRYISEMRKIAKRHKGNKITFLVFSDEPRTQAEFSEFKDAKVVLSNNLFIVDLFLLSKCHELLGPPSTFTQFASWYGQNQLNVIE